MEGAWAKVYLARDTKLDRKVALKIYLAPYHFAIVYAGLGETDVVFEYLEKGYEERSPWMTWLKVEPKFDSLRSDPRYTRLLRRVGFLR